MSDVVVIGAGAVGACTALALLADGHRVTVVEPRAAGGDHAASYGNGGWLSTASVVPMSLPGLWKNIPRYLLDADGPLVIRAGSLPRLATWLVRFLAAGHRLERVARTARALSALLHDAPARHAALAREAGVADLVIESGLTYVYPSRKAFEAESLAWQLRRAQRVIWREIDRDELRRHTPALASSYGFGIEVPAGGHCRDPGAYVAALAALARSRGARWINGSATGLVVERGRLRAVRAGATDIATDYAVICAGIDSAHLAHQAGSRIPLESERGYHVVLPADDLLMRTPLMPSDGKMAVTQTVQGLRISGQVELASRGAGPDWRRADILLRHAQRMFPSLSVPGSSAGIPRWLGHRPSTPDGLPVLGRCEGSDQVFCAFGHGHVGLASAPASAELIADLIAGREPRIDPLPYRASRFTGG
ncbi:MAG: FAD-binding oxidoreductase [Betaproteobacteria bacterium]|nr:FAD-binding oxidoreductase [Betaproteobacteria bacterium]